MVLKIVGGCYCFINFKGGLIGFRGLSRKNFLIIFAVFIFLIALGNVSANDIDDNLDNLTDTSDDIVLSSESSNDILTADESFNSLQSLIDSKGNDSTIDLNTNYTYSSGDSRDGIRIDKTLTINGNGHSIDGDGVARIFNITGNGVVLNNITIKNAFISNTLHYINSTNKNVNISVGNGAGILWTGDNGVISNSQIINNMIVDDITFYNTADSYTNYLVGNGAGAFISGENTTIENTIIANNTIKYNIIYQNNYRYYPNSDVIRIVANGAGVYISGNNTNIRKSKFTNNIVNGSYNNTDKDGVSINSESTNNNIYNYFMLGGALKIMGDNVNISDSTFKDNIAYQGGAIHTSGNNTNITKSNFTYNTGTHSAGALNSYNPFKNSVYTMSISDSYFTNNHAVNYAGVFINNYINNVVKDSTFINNTAGTYAGAILYGGTSGTLINSTFTDNTAGTYGGAISWSGATGNVINSTFTKNTAGTYGGAIYWSGSSGSVVNSTFTDNTATFNNDIRRISTLILKNNTFTGKYAVIDSEVLSGFGYFDIKATSDEVDILVDINIDGEYYDTVYLDAYSTNDVRVYLNNLQGNNPHTIDLEFINGDNTYNNIQSSFKVLTGGYTLYVSPKGNSDGLSSSTPANWSYAYNNIPKGGTIILLNGTYNDIVNQSINKALTIKGSGNTVLDAQQFGKMFTIYADNVTIIGITFINGYSTLDYGGSIYWVGSNAVLSHSTFINNKHTSQAGAVWFTGNNTIVNYCNFINNSANSHDGAIVIYNGGYNSVYYSNVSFCNFTGNRAITGRGGAGYFGYANSIVSNCIFKDNNAKTYAGAIQYAGATGLITDSDFINNSAVTHSGAIYWTGSNGNLTNSRFTDNNAGSDGGSIYWSGSDGFATFNNFTNNTAKGYSNDIYRSSTTVFIYYNRFIGNYASITSDVIVDHESFTIKATSDEDNMVVGVLVDGVNVKNVTINSGIVGDTLVELSSDDYGQHTLDLTFSSVYNTYINNPVSFNVVSGGYTLYVSPDGQGSGFDMYEPCNWTYAYDNIPVGGTIVLLDGVYSDIIDVAISKSMNITGSSNTIIDAGLKGGMFRVYADNVTISNICFTKSSSAPVIFSNANYGVLKDCNYTYCSGSTGWSGNYSSVINCTITNSTRGISVSSTSYYFTFDGLKYIDCYGAFGNPLGYYTVIRNSVFKNVAGIGEGIFYFSANSHYAVVENCVFDNITARATAFMNYGGTASLTVRNCNFTNNVVTTGATVWVQSGGSSYIGCLFENNTGKQGGGMVIFSTTTIRNCSYIDNSADYGAAIYCRSNANVYDSIFTNNTAGVESNDIYRVSGSTMSGNTFIGDYASITPKVIRGNEYLTVKLTSNDNPITVKIYVDGVNTQNTTIPAKTIGDTNILLTNIGGGSHTLSFDVISVSDVYTIYPVSFEVVDEYNFYVSPNGNGSGLNISDACNWTYALENIPNGGTIFLLNGTYTDILDQNIAKSINIIGSGNTVIDGGNKNLFLTINADNVTVDNVIFINGYHTSSNANNLYGVVRWLGDNGRLLNCNFTNNYDSRYYGGAIYWTGNNALINNTVFSKNSDGSNGGALGILGNNATVSYCNFTDNYANCAGAIYTSSSTTNSILINDCIFIGNRATGTYAGAVLIQFSNSTIVDCKFINNTANTYGSAIVCIRDNGIIQDCTFEGNIAKTYGTIYWTGNNGKIIDCNFTNNTAGIAGVLYVTGTGGSITGSKCINNTATTTYNDIYTSNSLTVTDNTFIHPYISIDSQIIKGFEYLTVNPVSEYYSVKLGVYVNSTNHVNVTIPANSSTYTRVFLPNLGVGRYNVTVQSLDNSNSYSNIEVLSFELINTQVVYYVSRNGNGDGSSGNPCSWDYALENIPSGGTIILLNGTYKNIINQDITKSLKIIGSGNTVLDAVNRNRFFTVSTDNVTICNITFMHGYSSSDGACILWNGANGTITGCTFINNTAKTSSNDIYRGNTILNIGNCTFIGNYIGLNDTNIINNLVFPIKITSGNDDVLVGVFVDGYNKGNVTVVGNSTTDCVFTLSNLNTGVHNITLSFSEGENVYVQNRLVTINFVDNSVFYVSPYGRGKGTFVFPCSWDYAYENVPDGGTIILLNGTYNNIVKFTIGKSVTIRGSGNTILDAGKSGKIFIINSPVFIDNIKFTNGQDKSGGVLSISNNAHNSIISNCIFDNNYATYRGGAIYTGYMHNLTIVNCTFINNTADNCGGVFCADSSGVTGSVNVTFKNCSFINNTANYGGVIGFHNYATNYKIINSTFINNNATSSDGGAVYFTSNCINASVINSNFINNHANRNGGAIFGFGTNYLLSDCNFTNNSALNRGGAIYSQWHVPAGPLNNLVFKNNTAKSGAAIYNSMDLTLSNCEFKDNLDSSTIKYTYTSNSMTITYNGVDNMLNGIYTGLDLTLINVSYWNNGERNAPSDTIYRNTKQNISIILELYDINNQTRLVNNYSGYTNSNGIIAFDGWDFGSYHVKIYHATGPTRSISTEFDYMYIVYASPNGNSTGYGENSPSNLTNAINICSAGGKIILANGVYNISEEITLNKQITIIGGSDTTLKATNNNRILKVTADNVSICNVTFMNGNADQGGAVYWTGKNGVLNNTRFYNNTAGSGSAIYTTQALKIYNSIFLDNTADVDFTYTKSDDGFTVHINNHDNYINAIYASSAPTVSNITYWGATGKVTNSNTINAYVGHNLTVVLSNRVEQTPIKTESFVTDSNGNITKTDLAKNIYYDVLVKHYTGLTKYKSILFDIPVNVTVSKLELYVPSEIKEGENLTVIALVNSTAEGSLNFTINNKSIGIVDIVDGRAVLSVDPNLGIGNYELVVVYTSTNGFYSQRNSTNFTVKVKSPATISVIAPESGVNNTILSITAKLNFIAPTELQLVVRLQHFFNHTFFMKIF